MGKILQKFARLIFSLIGILLIFRFILKLFGASSASSFVSFIFENTQPLVAPFIYAFPSSSISGRFVIEFTTLFALFVYGFISYILEEVLNLMSKSKK
jgi:uncharacterized protein YggT (Ycf19 family)